MKITSCLFVFIIVAMLLVTSCAGNGGDTSPTSSAPPSSTAPEGDISILVQGNTEFTFDLYQQMKDMGGNFFISPYSISTAFAMTYAGARDETEQQMADTLHFTLPQESLHAAFAKLDSLFKEMVEWFRLNIANAIWGQEGYDFLPTYLELIKTYYGCDLHLLDFINEPGEAIQEINQWASDQTEGRIKNILDSSSIHPLVRLILANATYFKANWAHKFNENNTSNDNFYLLDGSTVTVPMMHQQQQFDYAEDDTYQAIRLPYTGNKMAMTVLLPRAGEFESFENSLDAQILKEIVDKMEPKQVDLSLPKFTFESTYRLETVLAEMGMPIAFSGAADFSGMTSDTSLFIGSAIHKSFVSVDEVSTEAAAVQGNVIVVSATPAPTVRFTANRPFIFLIQDLETGSILFIGRTLNPAA